MIIPCSECKARLPAEAEACPDCGYPVTARADAANARPVAGGQPIREYRFMQLAGIIVCGAGLAAVTMDARVAASIALVVGTGTYIAGLIGAWWNTAE